MTTTTFADTLAVQRVLSQAADTDGLARLEARNYHIKMPLVVPDGVNVAGDGATLISVANVGSFVTLGSGSALDGVEIRSEARVNRMIAIAPKARDVRISGVKIAGSGTEAVGIAVDRGVNGLAISDCEIKDVQHGIRLQSGPRNSTIERVSVQRWSHRGIRIQGDDTSAAQSVLIRDVEVGPNVGNGPSRYPIIALSTGMRHRDITVEDSVVTGRGTAHQNPMTPGTADQISINDTVGVTIRRNESLDGGERGVNVLGSTDVLIADNTVRDADTVGIGVGSARMDTAVERVVIRDNLVVNSGRNRVGSTTDPSLAGIRVSQTTRGTLEGNAIQSTGTGQRQKYGVTVDTTADVLLAGNTFVGSFVEEVFQNNGQHQVQQHQGMK